VKSVQIRGYFILLPPTSQDLPPQKNSPLKTQEAIFFYLIF